MRLQKALSKFCFCITGIHPHSHFGPHEIQFLLLKFILALRKVLGFFWLMGRHLGRPAPGGFSGHTESPRGQKAERTWEMEDFILGSSSSGSMAVKGARAHTICLAHHPAVPLPQPHVAPGPSPGPSAWRLEGDALPINQADLQA